MTTPRPDPASAGARQAADRRRRSDGAGGGGDLVREWREADPGVPRVNGRWLITYAVDLAATLNSWAKSDRDLPSGVPAADDDRALPVPVAGDGGTAKFSAFDTFPIEDAIDGRYGSAASVFYATNDPTYQGDTYATTIGGAVPPSRTPSRRRSV